MSSHLAAPPSSSLRQQLLRALPGDADLDAFCLDYFPQVHQRFSLGMDRQAKLNLLLLHIPATQIQATLERHASGAPAYVRAAQSRHAASPASFYGLLSLVLLGAGLCLGFAIPAYLSRPATPQTRRLGSQAAPALQPSPPRSVSPPLPPAPAEPMPSGEIRKKKGPLHARARLDDYMPPPTER